MRKKTVSNPFLDAVRFVSHAQRARGDEASTHCMIRYGHIVAHNGTLAAGAPIAEDDLNCYPQTDLLRLALERCSQDVIWHLVENESSLYVQSGAFSAYVPVAPMPDGVVPVPDQALGPLGDTFRDSLTVTAPLVRESARSLLESVIQLNDGSTITSNGAVVLEHWHGWSMPAGLLVPKAFADAVCKIKKPIESFGFSKTTLTVHYADYSWLMTKLYTDTIPAIAKVLVDAPNAMPFPPMFFDQAEQVGKFSDTSSVYLYDNAIRSHHPDRVSAGAYQSIPMPELTQGVSYGVSALKSVSKLALTYDAKTNDRATMIFGNNIRGAIAHTKIVRKVETPKRCEGGYKGIADDDIPF